MPFTNRGDRAHEVFHDLIIWSENNLPELILGVGSIIDAPTTALYIQLGANFIVSPVLNPEMAKICNRRKISWSPGCGTLTEISYAEELGAEVVKIFPGESVGGAEIIFSIIKPVSCRLSNLENIACFIHFKLKSKSNGRYSNISCAIAGKATWG